MGGSFYDKDAYEDVFHGKVSMAGPKITCPYCGSLNLPHQTKCESCGGSLRQKGEKLPELP